MIAFLQRVLNKIQSLFGIFRDFLLELKGALLDPLQNLSPQMQLAAFFLLLLGIFFVGLLFTYFIRFVFLIKLSLNKQLKYERYNKKYKHSWLKKYQKRIKNRSKDKKGFLKALLLPFRKLADLLILGFLHTLNGIGKLLNLFRVRFAYQQIRNPIIIRESVQDTESKTNKPTKEKKERPQKEKKEKPKKKKKEKPVEMVAAELDEFTQMIENYSALLQENEELKSGKLDSLTKEKDKEIARLKEELDTIKITDQSQNDNAVKELKSKENEIFNLILMMANNSELSHVKRQMKSLFDKYNLELINPTSNDYFSARLMTKVKDEITHKQKLDGQISEVVTIGMYNTETQEIYKKAEVALYKFEEKKEEPLPEIEDEEIIDEPEVQEEVQETQEPELEDQKEPEEQPEEVSTETTTQEEQSDDEEVEPDVVIEETDDVEEESEPTEEEKQEVIDAIFEEVEEDTEPTIEDSQEEPVVQEEVDEEPEIEEQVVKEQVVEEQEDEPVVDDEQEPIEESIDFVEPEELTLKQKNVDENLMNIIDEVIHPDDQEHQTEEETQEEQTSEPDPTPEQLPEEEKEVEDLIQKELEKWMKENK